LLENLSDFKETTYQSVQVILGINLIYKMCSCHDMAEILLKLALNTNQSYC